MGSMTQAMRSISGADEAERKTKERLDLLLLAAKAKIQAYREEINEAFLNPAMIDKKQIPGIRAIRFIEQYHVASRESFNKQVSDHLGAAIDAFFSIGGKDVDTKKAVQSGVHSLISTALDGFIGATAAGESEQKIYVIIPENNAFVRVDIACWKYNFTQEKLIAQSDSAVAYVLCKSVVDHSKLTIDELIYLATEALSKDAPKSLPLPVDAPASATGESAISEALMKLGYDDIAVRKWLAKALSSSAEAKVEVRDYSGNKSSYNYAALRQLSVASDRQITLMEIPKEESFAIDKLTWIMQPQLLDAHSRHGRDPSSITAVEAYIEELIRVWKKLKDDRKDS